MQQSRYFRGGDKGVLTMRAVLALLFCSLIGSAFAQSAEQKNTITGNTAQQRGTEVQGTENIPFVVKVLPPSDAEKKATDEREDRKEKIERELNNLTEKLATYTLVIAGIGVLQLFVFGFQGVMLKRTVDLGRQEFISTHRPRIRIKHVWLAETVEAGKPVMVQVISVNTGDTEAQIVGFNVITHIVPRFRHPPNDPFDGHPKKDVGYISNQVMLESGLSLDHGSRESGHITLAEIDDIRKGDALMYCFAHVVYLDKSEPPLLRKTSCCRILAPDTGGAFSTFGGRFVQCPDSEYEYAD